jgi:hypothetical protein
MRHLTVLLAFLVSFSIQAAGVVGFGGSKLIPEGTIKDVRNYGIAGNSATNYSTQLQNMIASNLTAGDVIGFFYGTNTVSGITLSNTQSIYIAPGAVVKWPDSATNAMFTMTADWKGIIYGGGTIDGGTQTTNQFRYNGLLNTRSDNGKIENITFRNSVRAAIYDISSYGNLEITGCRFFNAMQLPTTATFANSFVTFAPGQSNTAPHFRFTGNILSNSTLTGRWSGGVYVAASDASSSANSFLIADNHFYNVGDDHAIGAAHYGIAAIDIYEDSRNGVVRGNHIYNTRYIGVKGQNTQNLLIEGNFIYESAATVGVMYTSGERFQTNAYNSAIIRNNFVKGNGTSTYGVWVGPGDSGTNVMNVIIDGNILTNVYRGVNLQGYNSTGVVSAMGPIKIRNNIISATNNSAITIYGTKGDVDITGNTITTQGAGNGITAVQTNTTLSIRIDGNEIDAVGYGVAVWGVTNLIGDNNKISSSTSEAIYFKADADGNKIGFLAWGPKNKIRNGTETITQADILGGYAWSGDDITIYPGGLVMGPTSGIQYRFRYNTNVAENILRVHNLDASGTGAALFTVGATNNLFTIGVYGHSYSLTDVAGRVELKPESNSNGLDVGSKTSGKATRIFGGTTAGVTVLGQYVSIGDSTVLDANDGESFSNTDGDDTAELQSALDAAGENEKIILHPKDGNYIISSALKFRNGQIIEGWGGNGQFNSSDTNQVTIRMTGSGTNAIFEPYNTSADTINVQIRNLKLQGNGNTYVGVKMYRTSYSVIENCLITDCEVGVEFDANTSNQAYFNTIRGGKIAYNDEVNVRFKSGANANRLYDVWLGGAPRSVELLSLSVNNEFHGCHFQGVAEPDGTSIHVYADANYNTLFGGWVESCGTAVYENSGSVSVFATTIGGLVTNIVQRNSVAPEGIKMFKRPNDAATDSGFVGQLGSLAITNFSTTASNPIFLTAVPRNSTNAIQYNWGYGGETTHSSIQSLFYSGTNANFYVDHLTGSAIGNNENSKLQLWTVQVLQGTGTPEGAVTAEVGSMFLRRDGGAGTSFYVKESGSGNTGWVAK